MQRRGYPVAGLDMIMGKNRILKKKPIILLVDALLFSGICFFGIVWVVWGICISENRELALFHALAGFILILVSLWARNSWKGASVILLAGLIAVVIFVTQNKGATVLRAATPAALALFGVIRLLLFRTGSPRNGAYAKPDKS